MKIGDLPEVTSPTKAYKVAVEDTNGFSKRVTLLNILQRVLGDVSLGSNRTVSSIFTTYDNDYATISAATLYGFGKYRELRCRLTLKNAVSVSLYGSINAVECGRVKSIAIPAEATLGFVRSPGYSGIAQLQTTGYMYLLNMDARSTPYNVPANEPLDFEFHFLSNKNM